MTGYCLIWTLSYNNCNTFSKPKLNGNREKTIVALFRFLGWIFAEDGDRAQPFDLRCSALGISFNLELAA